MHHLPRPDRRGFLRFAGLLAGSTLLSGCGGGSGKAETDAAATAAATTVAEGSTAARDPASPLNLALTLAYVGAQYYGEAALGTTLPAAATAGVGTPGDATGARRVGFADPALAAYAAEIAADKHDHVLALRDQLGAASAAQPAIDLSAAGAFAAAARGAALPAFDPYADDAGFLAGAWLVENRVAAAYRTILDGMDDVPATATVAANLAGAIYHGGLIRTLLDERAGASPLAAAVLVNGPGLLARVDGSNVGDQSLAGARGESADLIDAAGRPIAFTRSQTQVLAALYLSPRPGGFLPAGVNGIA